MMKRLRTKAHTLPSRTSRHRSQNLAKSVLFPTQEEIQFFFSLPLEKIKTPDTQTDMTKTVKLNKENGLQTRWTRTPAGNSRFAKAGVSCFYESEVLNSVFLHLMKFSAENPRLRKAANR